MKTIVEKKWAFGPAIKIELLGSKGQIDQVSISPAKKGLEWKLITEDPEPKLAKAVEEWLTQYAKGEEPTVKVPCNLKRMTPYTVEALETVAAIPFGEVLSYKDVACKMNHPQAARAIGGACRRNPVPLFIPCHRVIASNNTLRGYSAGGIAIKQILLDFEENAKGA